MSQQVCLYLNPYREVNSCCEMILTELALHVSLAHCYLKDILCAFLSKGMSAVVSCVIQECGLSPYDVAEIPVTWRCKPFKCTHQVKNEVLEK